MRVILFVITLVTTVYAKCIAKNDLSEKWILACHGHSEADCNEMDSCKWVDREHFGFQDILLGIDDAVYAAKDDICNQYKNLEKYKEHTTEMDTNFKIHCQPNLTWDLLYVKIKGMALKKCKEQLSNILKEKKCEPYIIDQIKPAICNKVRKPAFTKEQVPEINKVLRKKELVKSRTITSFHPIKTEDIGNWFKKQFIKVYHTKKHSGKPIERGIMGEVSDIMAKDPNTPISQVAVDKVMQSIWDQIEKRKSKLKPFWIIPQNQYNVDTIIERNKNKIGLETVDEYVQYQNHGTNPLALNEHLLRGKRYWKEQDVNRKKFKEWFKKYLCHLEGTESGAACDASISQSYDAKCKDGDGIDPDCAALKLYTDDSKACNSFRHSFRCDEVTECCREAQQRYLWWNMQLQHVFQVANDNKKGLVLYHGVQDRCVTDEVMKVLNGNKISWKGPLSWTTKINVAETFADGEIGFILKATIVEGQKGGIKDVKAISASPHEFEVLLYDMEDLQVKFIDYNYMEKRKEHCIGEAVKHKDDECITLPTIQCPRITSDKGKFTLGKFMSSANFEYFNVLHHERSYDDDISEQRNDMALDVHSAKHRFQRYDDIHGQRQQYHDEKEWDWFLLAFISIIDCVLFIGLFICCGVIIIIAIIWYSYNTMINNSKKEEAEDVIERV